MVMLPNSQEKPTDERVTRIDRLGSWFVARGPRLVDIVSSDFGFVPETGGLCQACARLVPGFVPAKSEGLQGL
jgi:hypothetical protein